MGAVQAQQGSASDKTLKLVVPFPAGGSTDMASRIVGQRLAERLKQTVVIENRAGASGAIAAAQVAKSVPDGSTLMMLATPTMLAPHFNKAAGYDTTKDFTPVATVYDLPIVIVVNAALLPDVTDLAKLIAYAKAQPKPMHYTSSGVGSFGHLSMELLQQLAAFEMQHVPYKGGVPAITDTLGGVVPVMYSDLVAALPHIKSGKLRAIAIGSPQRVSVVPDVKTISEQGIKGYDAISWGGLMVTKGTPKPVVDRFAQEIQDILADKEVQYKLRDAGCIANFQGPSQMAQRVQSDYAKWGRVIRDRSISNEADSRTKCNKDELVIGG
ncbi:tripartite tricarboxylate transporter substrate binding protein [Limnohabitans sp.]|uniref:Bug family tripartite tricarboxylate transporter substrate binding protein n=1 Tax=Limnohabitans sp. TaxID=1907725 RepID=UPI00286EE113|nr:tripartite tricarboxylate transporter substrate binding protein [Limnohabitans sp.]